MAGIKNKKKDDRTRKVTVTLPDELYISLREHADADIRSVAHEAQYMILVGMEYVNQMNAQQEEEPPELESAIGFKVDSAEVEEYEDDE
jgi:hypothetical protein